MSTQALLAKLETDGKLFRFAPSMRHRLKRRLYLTTAAQKDFMDPNSASNLLPRPSGFVNSAMVRWVSNGRVWCDEKGIPRFLKELDPPPVSDVWEIKVSEPDPQVRLIGGFLERDTLILTRFRTRSFLGKRGSEAWNEAVTGCVAAFMDLFGHPPFHGQRVSDYISENFDDFALKR